MCSVSTLVNLRESNQKSLKFRAGDRSDCFGSCWTGYERKQSRRIGCACGRTAGSFRCQPLPRTKISISLTFVPNLSSKTEHTSYNLRAAFRPRHEHPDHIQSWQRKCSLCVRMVLPLAPEDQ